MAVSAQRRLAPQTTRRFGSGREHFPIGNLTKIQTESYKAFLQEDAAPEKRKDQGLESVMREIFPITSYTEEVKLDYLR
jgi:DNA-directed RNA polymerase subunit beta